MSEAERVLWRTLRDRRFAAWKFRRQFPIGRYVVDFVCLEARLIVESDGPLHDTAQARLHDMQRDAWLRDEGFDILRLPNDLVLGAVELAAAKIEEAIARAARSDSPSPGLLRKPPSPARGEGS